jgi:hypothetical protein
MAEVNWVVLAYFLIGLFALSGFYRGWWKEAITTIFLALLVFLLQVPLLAQLVVEFMNFVLANIWPLLPDFVLDFLQTVVGLQSGANPPHIQPGSAQTWLIILLLFIGLATIISRSVLPASGQQYPPYTGYIVTYGGSIFGAALGALNGWLIISLVQTYLEGVNLPSDGQVKTAVFSDRMLIQAVNVPTATILDSFMPFLFVTIGLIVFIVAVQSRIGIHHEKGFRRIAYKSPLGHKKFRIS